MTETLHYAPVAFEEEQHFRHPIFWALILLIPTGVVSFSLYTLAHGPGIHRMPLASTLAVLAGMLLSIAVPLLLWSMKLVTRLTPDALYLRFFPLWTKRIRLADIASCEPRTYSPLKEYGGWGIRYTAKGWAYNVSGNRGVQLILQNGQKILVGSRRADDLANAINDLRAEPAAAAPLTPPA